MGVLIVDLLSQLFARNGFGIAQPDPEMDFREKLVEDGKRIILEMKLTGFVTTQYYNLDVLAQARREEKWFVVTSASTNVHYKVIVKQQWTDGLFNAGIQVYNPHLRNETFHQVTLRLSSDGHIDVRPGWRL
jgi:hypothetical protein